MLMKVKPVINCTKILCIAFVLISFCQKFKNQNSKNKKNCFLYKKCARRTLLKLTPALPVETDFTLFEWLVYAKI